MRTKLIAVGMTLLAAGVGAGAGAAPATASPEAEALARQVAAPWTSLQAPSGAFTGYEPVGASARYGEAVMGLGLLQAGVREKNDALVWAGLSAEAYVLRLDPATRGASAFENWGLAAAYNVARRRLRKDMRFVAMRPAWELRLRSLTPIFLSHPRGGFFNKHLVEAVSWLELARTGLRSRVRGTVLRHPGQARAQAVRYLVRDLPRLTERSRIGNLRLLADPRPSPLAYHALSLGFYARGLSFLNRHDRRRAGRILLQAARASLSLAAPGRGRGLYGSQPGAVVGAGLHRLRRGGRGGSHARPQGACPSPDGRPHPRPPPGAPPGDRTRPLARARARGLVPGRPRPLRGRQRLRGPDPGGPRLGRRQARGRARDGAGHPPDRGLRPPAHPWRRIRRGAHPEGVVRGAPLARPQRAISAPTPVWWP